MKVIDKKDNKYVIETKPCFHCGNTGTVEIYSRELLISGTHGICLTDMFGEDE